MRVLLDECVPSALAQLLSSHEVKTVQQVRWSGIKNGALLKLAETEFDVFLTADQNLRFQQNLVAHDIAVVQVSTNKLKVLQEGIELIADAIGTSKSGTVLVVTLGRGM